MVISECDLGTMFGSKGSEISVVISQGVSYKIAFLLIFPFSIYDHKIRFCFSP